MTNWHTQLNRKLHLDFHQPEWMTGVAAAITPDIARQQAERIKQAGFEAVAVFVYDHHGFCMFPYDGVPLKSHPHLAADYVGLMVEALRAVDLRMIAYVNVFSNIYLHQTHPDWMVTAPDGAQPGAAWLHYPSSHVCVSSPFIDSVFVPFIEDVMHTYGFDGVWLDGGNWLIDTALCHCPYCQQKFKAVSGYDVPTQWAALPRQPTGHATWQPHALPTYAQWTQHDQPDDTDPQWVAWRLWKLSQIQDYLDVVVGAIKAVKPDAIVADNNVGIMRRPFVKRNDAGQYDWVRPAESGVDFLSTDPVSGVSNHMVILSREGRYQATTGVSFDYMIERFMQWGEWHLRALIDIQLELATVMAVGGRCFLADQPYPDGSLEPHVYTVFEQANAFTIAREPYVMGASMLPDVAVLRSAASRVFGPYSSGLNAMRSPGPVGSKAGERMDRIHGAHIALIEHGIQCLIYDEPTLREALDQQQAVIIPEQPLLEAATIHALQAYVERGGVLIVTGRTGWWDERYVRRETYALDTLLGIKTRGEHRAPIHYLMLDDQQALPPHPIQMWGKAVDFEVQDAMVLAHMQPPRAENFDGDTFRHWTTLGAAPPDFAATPMPAITLREVGAGRVLFMAVDPYAAYAHEGHHLIQRLLAHLMDAVLPPEKRRFAVRKPLHVECSVQIQANRTCVHLLNFFAQRRARPVVTVEEVMPVQGVEISVAVDSPPQRVTQQPENIPLEWVYTDGRVVVRDIGFDVHTIVVIEG